MTISLTNLLRLDFTRCGILVTPRFTSRLSLPYRNISQPLGFRSSLIYTFSLSPSLPVSGMSSRTLTTNVSLVSTPSYFKFSSRFEIVIFICIFLVVLYAVSAVYFAGVMVRLMLTLTPVVCVLSAIAFSRLLEFYLKVIVYGFYYYLILVLIQLWFSTLTGRGISQQRK